MRILASLVPGCRSLQISKNQGTFVAKNMQVIIYLVLALISIVYTKVENGTNKGPEYLIGLIGPHKDSELAKKGVLETDTFTGEHISTKSPQSCQQDQLDAMQKRMCSRSHLAGFGNKGAINCIDNVISVRDCDCVTYDSDKCSVLLGPCPYGCGFTTKRWSGQAFHPLTHNLSDTITNDMCGRLNRAGPMCSKCKTGFSPLVYSYDLTCITCTNSHYNWINFVAAAFIPLTFFYFVVLLFRIDATSPYLYGFITFNQALASPLSLRAMLLTLKRDTLLAGRLIAIPYTVWNLDFFRSLPLNICLDLTTLQTLALDYAIAIYPLLLVIITYIVIELHARGCRVLVWLWRPFHRCCVRFSRVMDIQSSIIKAFATFLLLSYVKLLNATLDILIPVQIYYANPNKDGSGWYVYYDASYQYFSKDHLPYALLGISLFLMFGLCPLVLLIVYPMSCFQRYCYGASNYALHIFIDAFQGHYKDGTEPGTHDCRWFAGIYFLGRIMILFAIFGAIKSCVCYTLAGFSLMAIGMLIILLQPFKSTKVNTYHTLLPFTMATGYFTVALIDEVASNDHWMIRIVVPLIEIFYISPILAVIVYATYRFFRRYRTT